MLSGYLFIVGYNVVCGILRGLGDSKNTTLFCWTGMCDKYSARFYIGRLFPLGGYGAAIATVTAQGVSFGSALVLISARIPF